MHLPLDFHHLAFYVLDEDTVGCVVGGWVCTGIPSYTPIYTPRRSVLPPTPDTCPHGSTGECWPWSDLLPPFHRHDDTIGKISLSKEAITADPRGEQFLTGGTEKDDLTYRGLARLREWPQSLKGEDSPSFFFFFQDRISLCNSSGCHGTRFVSQAGIELTEIRLPLRPKCWD